MSALSARGERLFEFVVVGRPHVGPEEIVVEPSFSVARSCRGPGPSSRSTSTQTVRSNQGRSSGWKIPIESTSSTDARGRGVGSPRRPVLQSSGRIATGRPARNGSSTSVRIRSRSTPSQSGERRCTRGGSRKSSPRRRTASGTASTRWRVSTDLPAPANPETPTTTRSARTRSCSIAATTSATSVMVPGQRSALDPGAQHGSSRIAGGDQVEDHGVLLGLAECLEGPASRRARGQRVGQIGRDGRVLLRLVGGVPASVGLGGLDLGQA